MQREREAPYRSGFTFAAWAAATRCTEAPLGLAPPICICNPKGDADGSRADASFPPRGARQRGVWLAAAVGAATAVNVQPLDQLPRPLSFEF